MKNKKFNTGQTIHANRLKQNMKIISSTEDRGKIIYWVGFITRKGLVSKRKNFRCFPENELSEAK